MPVVDGSTRATHIIVLGLFILVALLVRFGLGLVRPTLLVAQGFPALAENFADLACDPDRCQRCS